MANDLIILGDKIIKEYDGIYYDLNNSIIYYDVTNLYSHMFGEGIISKILLELQSDLDQDNNETGIIAYIDQYRNRFITKASSLDPEELRLTSHEIIVEFINGHIILVEAVGDCTINKIIRGE